MSISTENYIKAIYRQSQITGGDTKPGTLARLLNVTNAAATDMARNLASKNLVNYNKYKQLTLTPEGQIIALKVIRKHRLWEAFLFKTLKLSLHEIHREAEILEHLTSDFLSEKIDNYLGKPSLDPHGDPIPDFNGNFSESSESIVLSIAEPGKYYIISRLFASDEDFFYFCNSNQILIGSTIKVERQYDANSSTEIEVNNNRLLLNREFTNLIYVTAIE